MDTPFMDIAKSETLRGFTELTLFYMSDLDDSSSSFSSLLFFVQSSFTQCSPNLFVCVLVIERSAKVCTACRSLELGGYVQCDRPTAQENEVLKFPDLREEDAVLDSGAECAHTPWCSMWKSVSYSPERKRHTYRVGSVNFSRRKLGHAHDNSADSENVAGARKASVHAHFVFRFENGQGNQTLCSIHDQKTAETSQPQAQPTDGWRAIDRAFPQGLQRPREVKVWFSTA